MLSSAGADAVLLWPLVYNENTSDTTDADIYSNITATSTTTLLIGVMLLMQMSMQSAGAAQKPSVAQLGHTSLQQGMERRQRRIRRGMPASAIFKVGKKKEEDVVVVGKGNAVQKKSWFGGGRVATLEEEKGVVVGRRGGGGASNSKKAMTTKKASAGLPSWFGSGNDGGNSSSASSSAKNAKGKRNTATAAKKAPVDKAAEYKRRQGVGGIISAFDFAEVRSKSDAELLYEAKYGKLENGKMSREQYQALRRKVGGTAKDFWKDSIDVEGEYTDKGYVSEDVEPVSGLPFLILTVLALIGTAVFVAIQTSS